MVYCFQGNAMSAETEDPMAGPLPAVELGYSVPPTPVAETNIAVRCQVDQHTLNQGYDSG